MMTDFDKLVEEAKATRDNVSKLFTIAYDAGQDTTRLQRIFDKLTDRIIRRMSYVWLLDYAKNYKA